MKQIYASAAEYPVALGRVAMSRGFDGHGGKLMESVVLKGVVSWK
jgi:hypothetical protein